MKSVTVVFPVSNLAERREFLTFPWKVYAGDPNWVPPLLSKQSELIDPAQNPFFEHASAEFFLARRNGEVVGTIAAFTNHLFNEAHHDRTGFFGFFEVVDDPKSAAMLFEAAESWAHSRGHDTILGPMQYSTNDELGLLINGFDDPPRILMTYNPRRYQTYFETAGYEKAVDLLSYVGDVDELYRNFPEKIRRVTEKILKRWNLSVRPLRVSDFDAEVRRVVQIYNAGWSANWGAVPVTEREMWHLAKEIKSVLDPDLTVVVERDGVPVAIGIVLPDVNQALKLAYPRPGVPELVTLTRLYWHWKVRKSVTGLRLWALGVLPEFQGQGLDALLMGRLLEAAHVKGYKTAEMGWVLETNEKINRNGALFGMKVCKTHRVYKKSL